MTKLIAEKPIYYAGRTRRRGEVFDATEAHAAILLLTRNVKAWEPEEVAEPLAKPRRKYKRRDIQAET